MEKMNINNHILFGANIRDRFNIANDDKVPRPAPGMATHEDRYLKEAVILGDAERFDKWLNACSQRGIDAALFYAAGLSRPVMVNRLVIAGGNMREVTNGQLLKLVMEGREDDVRYALKFKDGIDMHAHNEECFKQAILGNHTGIADLLHGHGVDLLEVMNDQRFLHNLWDVELVEQKTRNFLTGLVGSFDFEWREFAP